MTKYLLLWIKSILDKYSIHLWKNAKRNIEDIYRYLALECAEPENARSVTEKIHETIHSLRTFPNIYHKIDQGRYAGKGYRQVTVKNFTIIYKVSETQKSVSVVAVRHSSAIH